MKKFSYVVAVDGSEWSDRAAERAITLAAQTGAQVHFITALQWGNYQPLYVGDFTTQPILEKEEEEEAVRAHILTPLEERYADSGVTIKSDLYWGNPAEVVKKQAKKEHANMIFVGRRGRSKIADLFVGSVANSLAHTAGVPIVLVP